MATLTLSGPSGFIGGSGAWTGPFVGHSDSNYVLRYSFVTPSSGYITSLTFATTFRHSSGETGTKYVRVKVTESSTSHINAGANTSDYDGTMEVSGGYDNSKSCTINGLWLKPNTTYYVFLFPGSQYFLKFCYDNSGNDLGSLAYNSLVATYTLGISAGTGTSIAVNRVSSPSGSTGALSHYSTIYAGDVLMVTVSAETGYYIVESTYSNGASITVSGDVFVGAVGAVLAYTLDISAGAGSSITVSRTSSPLAGASTGTLSDGSMIYYSDVLQITTSANAGYEIKQQTINGSAFSSGISYNVAANVTIVTVTGLLGIVYIDTGSGFEKYLIYIDNGSSWEQYVPYVDSGSGWSVCH